METFEQSKIEEMKWYKKSQNKNSTKRREEQRII